MIIETCPICGGNLVDIMLASYPPIPKRICPCCGWGLTGEPAQILTAPFRVNGYTPDGIRWNPIQPSSLGYELSPCIHCSNNPRNGGSGICFCTLGQPTIT